MGFLLHVIGITGTSLFNILGLNMVFGKGKILHFGPLATSIVSSYCVFVSLPSTGNYFFSFLIGLGAALLLSMLFAWLSLRLQPDGLGVLSLAVHLAVLALVLNVPSLTRGALGIPGIPRISFLAQQEWFVLVVVILAALWVLCLWMLDRGPFGRQLAALSEQEWHASALGVSRARVHFFVFLIAGVGASLTSTLYHQYIGLLHPNDFGFPYFILMITIIVAGKPGSVLGVTAAAILLTALREGLRLLPLPLALLGPVRLILFGLILFVAVWYRRDSLFPPQRAV